MHRNVANVVPVTDLNAMAVIEYAVSSLGVRHIIVCGHYRCGGVRAVLQVIRPAPSRSGCSRCATSRTSTAPSSTPCRRTSSLEPRLCELNVAAQVKAVAASEIVESAWERGAELAVHGWIYDLGDGLLDLEVTVGSAGASC